MLYPWPFLSPSLFFYFCLSPTINSRSSASGWTKKSISKDETFICITVTTVTTLRQRQPRSWTSNLVSFFLPMWRECFFLHLMENHRNPKHLHVYSVRVIPTYNYNFVFQLLSHRVWPWTTVSRRFFFFLLNVSVWGALSDIFVNYNFLWQSVSVRDPDTTILAHANKWSCSVLL